jgi:hypothetical protein
MHEAILELRFASPRLSRGLRFLAEDVAKDLDGVLDALLRAVDHRRRGDS